MIEAEFKGITWLDQEPIEHYDPDPSKPFSVELTVAIGPKEGPGEELFLVDVSNALYLQEALARRGPHVLVSTILVERFSVAEVERIIRTFCGSCRGETWGAVVGQLMRLGRWEFEGMTGPEHLPPPGRMFGPH